MSWFARPLIITWSALVSLTIGEARAASQVPRCGPAPLRSQIQDQRSQAIQAAEEMFSHLTAGNSSYRQQLTRAIVRKHGTNLLEIRALWSHELFESGFSLNSAKVRDLEVAFDLWMAAASNPARTTAPPSFKALFEVVHALGADVARSASPEHLLATTEEVRKSESLFATARRLGAADAWIAEVHRFEKVLLSQGDLSQWIRSPAHALYAYQRLSGDALWRPVLSEMRNTHPELKGSVEQKGLPGTFVTFAFEKESPNKSLTRWYKDPRFTDEAWLALSESDRLTRLRELVNGKEKVFFSSDKIAPTALKPPYLGGYSIEADRANTGMFLIEVAHANYEISPRQIMTQIRETSAAVNEKHSIHVHLVVEFPAEYPAAHFENQMIWHKQFNDYLYLAGMNEGLHGNDLISVAALAREKGFEMHSQRLPEHIWEIKRNVYKGLSAGLRGTMYGTAHNPDHVRIGVELRDVTRNLDKLDAIVRTTSESLASRIWEKPKPPLPTGKTELRLSTNPSKAEGMLRKIGTHEDWVEFLAHIEPTLWLPLTNWETVVVYDYRTGKYRSPTPEQLLRLNKAKAQFIKGMRGLQEEILKYEKKGESMRTNKAKELVETAIRMDLSQWAKDARAHELFEGY